MQTTKEAAARLNELLTKSYDAEAGYQNAAEKVDDTQLKNYLNARAEQRNNFGHQLKSEITSLGFEPDKGTSSLGDLHRTWMNLRDALSGSNEALFEECIRGEEASVNEYKEVLKETSYPENVRMVLVEQQTSIEASLQQARQLENYAGKTPADS